jgi:DNA-binding transcriptional LysR family regulator
MDTLLNLRAFLTTARTGSFSKAARELGVAPSVVTKRVQQLEWQLRCPLFHRTTRVVSLTEIGERYVPSVKDIVNGYDEMAAGILKSPGEIEGHLRIKTPAAATARLLGKVFTDFQAAHPRVTLEVIVMDRSASPVEEGFDISLGVFSASYEGVVEEPLSFYPRMACASPGYLAKHGAPKTPRDLAEHHCLAFTPSGANWSFQTRQGAISINVHPHMSTNDAQLLLSATQAGHGISVLSGLVAAPALADGSIVRILEDYALPDLSLTAWVPKSRIHLARVQALLSRIREEVAVMPRLYEVPERRRGARVRAETVAAE